MGLSNFINAIVVCALMVENGVELAGNMAEMPKNEEEGMSRNRRKNKVKSTIQRRINNRKKKRVEKKKNKKHKHRAFLFTTIDKTRDTDQ